MPVWARTMETPQDTIVSTIPPFPPKPCPVTKQIAPFSRAALIARGQLEPKSRGCPVFETKKERKQHRVRCLTAALTPWTWLLALRNPTVSRMTGADTAGVSTFLRRERPATKGGEWVGWSYGVC
jgi:hypothetical protein